MTGDVNERLDEEVNPKNWESRGLIIEAYKTTNSTQPPIKVDIASTLGASSNLPLAVKKAVRYWFGPDIKTKNDVVQYINQTCRHNGFKISTLSNSKQGLDRRAQLVCSRGIIARKPRGKNIGVQTTTTRPVSLHEKCPFSLTVYECRKSGRWYLRKHGNGSRMHCGHIRLLPEQVGIRCFQSLTERDGERWSGKLTSTVCTPADGKGRHGDSVKRATNDADCLSTTEAVAPNLTRPTAPVHARQNDLPRTNSIQQTGPCIGMNLGLTQIQNARQSKEQLMNYIDGLRNRIAYRNVDDRFLLERACHNGWSAGNNSVITRSHAGPTNDLQGGIQNSNRRLILDQLEMTRQPHSTYIDSRLIGFLGVNHLMKDPISDYIDRAMLLNNVGVHGLSSLIQGDHFRWCGTADEVSNLLALIGARAANGSRISDVNPRDGPCISPIAAPTEEDCAGDPNKNEERKIANNDNSLFRWQSQPNNDSLSNSKSSTCFGAVSGGIRSDTGVVRTFSNEETNRSGNLIEAETTCKKSPSNESLSASRKRNGTDPQVSTSEAAEKIGSTLSLAKCLPDSETVRVANSNQLDVTNDDAEKSAWESTTNSNPLSGLDDYAMLRPMAIYEYASTLESYRDPEPETVPSNCNTKASVADHGIAPEGRDQTNGNENSNLVARSSPSKHCLYRGSCDSFQADEMERMATKRQKKRK